MSGLALVPTTGLHAALASWQTDIFTGIASGFNAIFGAIMSMLANFIYNDLLGTVRHFLFALLLGETNVSATGLDHLFSAVAPVAIALGGAAAAARLVQGIFSPNRGSVFTPILTEILPRVFILAVVLAPLPQGGSVAYDTLSWTTSAASTLTQGFTSAFLSQGVSSPAATSSVAAPTCAQIEAAWKAGSSPTPTSGPPAPPPGTSSSATPPNCASTDPAFPYWSSATADYTIKQDFDLNGGSTTPTGVTTTPTGTVVAQPQEGALSLVMVVLMCCFFLYAFFLLAVRLVILAFAIACAPICLALAVYSPKNGITQYWWKEFLSSLTAPIVMGTIFSITLAVATMFNSGASSLALTASSGAQTPATMGGLFAGIVMCAGLWFSGKSIKAIHGGAHIGQHNGFLGAMEATSATLSATRVRSLANNFRTQRSAASVVAAGGARRGATPAGAPERDAVTGGTTTTPAMEAQLAEAFGGTAAGAAGGLVMGAAVGSRSNPAAVASGERRAVGGAAVGAVGGAMPTQQQHTLTSLAAVPAIADAIVERMGAEGVLPENPDLSAEGKQSLATMYVDSDLGGECVTENVATLSGPQTPEAVAKLAAAIRNGAHRSTTGPSVTWAGDNETGDI